MFAINCSCNKEANEFDEEIIYQLNKFEETKNILLSNKKYLAQVQYNDTDVATQSDQIQPFNFYADSAQFNSVHVDLKNDGLVKISQYFKGDVIKTNG